jgi:hypothetical protein
VPVTTPVDRRIATAASEKPPAASTVCAKVVGDAPMDLEARADDRERTSTTRVPGAVALWQASLPSQRVTARARDVRWQKNTDSIEPVALDWLPPKRVADGSDRDRVGAWPDEGQAGGQLSANRNDRKW